MVDNAPYCIPKDSVNGNEMFSRVGKYTNSKYIILNKRDSIVQNKEKKKERQTSVPDIKDCGYGKMNHKRTSEPFIQEFCFISNNKRKNAYRIPSEQNFTPIKITIKKKDYISSSVTSTFKKINQQEYSVKKRRAPPCTHYNPKYLLVDKKIVNQYFAKNQGRNDLIKENKIDISRASTGIPLDLNSFILKKGIQFNKMIPRIRKDQMFLDIYSPVDIPSVSTLHQRIKTVNFIKSGARSNKNFEVNITPQKYNYDPVKFTMPCLSKIGLPFSKMIDRDKAWTRPVIKIKDSNVIDIENIHKYFDRLSNIKKINSPNFNQYKTREFSENLLPSYMVKIHNRITLNTLSAEMIKANKFAEKEDLIFSNKKFNRSKFIINSTKRHNDISETKSLRKLSIEEPLLSPFEMNEIDELYKGQFATLIEEESPAL